MRRAIVRVVRASVVAGVLTPASAWAQYGHGSIVGWGQRVFGVDLSGGFVAVAGGGIHSLGLKADGSIVAWGDDYYGKCDVPEANPDPNNPFVAVAAYAVYGTTACNGLPRHELRASTTVSPRVTGVGLAWRRWKWVR